MGSKWRSLGVGRSSVGRPEDADFNAAMASVLRRGESRGGPIDVWEPSLGNGSEALGTAALIADEATFQREDAHEFEKESTLLVLAELTGGQAMINSRRDEALARAAEDVRDYY